MASAKSFFKLAFSLSSPFRRLASETAQAAALVIKKNYPIVQVSVYDSVDNSNMLVEAPAASS